MQQKTRECSLCETFPGLLLYYDFRSSNGNCFRLSIDLLTIHDPVCPDINGIVLIYILNKTGSISRALQICDGIRYRVNLVSAHPSAGIPSELVFVDDLFHSSPGDHWRNRTKTHKFSFSSLCRLLRLGVLPSANGHSLWKSP